MLDRPQVLVVEDEPLVAEIIASALDDAYSVTVANTTVGAVHHLRDSPFAAVLLDCLLPDGGVEEIISAAELREVPIILMSGDPQRIETYSAVGRPFLAKPFSIETLQKTLRSVLS